MEIKKITYEHWKTGEHLICIGEIAFNNPQSDRLVVKCLAKGDYEDIIKKTIVSIEDYD